MIKLRKSFVDAIEAGEYKAAEYVLGQMYEIYVEQGGYQSTEEKIEFEIIVRWFDTTIVEAGLTA